MTAVRATATVSPAIAISKERALSWSFSAGTRTVQPALPAVRSICWRSVQCELCEPLSFTPTTSLPSADGACGTPHIGVRSGSFHRSFPSAAAWATNSAAVALTTTSPTRHGPYWEAPPPATSPSWSRSQTLASPGRMPALGS
nr:hypothetical protein [Streptomyces sp. NRRL F-4474]